MKKTGPLKTVIFNQQVIGSSPITGSLSKRDLRNIVGSTPKFGAMFCAAPGMEAMEVWRDYNKRAIIEQRIEELKAELHADGFCMQSFFATESAFLAVVFTFSLLSLYQKVTTPESAYRQPATLRSAVFLGGAILGRAALKSALLIPHAWGVIEKHIHLLERILAWEIPTSPKLGEEPLDAPDAYAI